MSQLIADAPPRYRIVFFHNGKDYDSTYVKKPCVQKIFKARGWGKRPFDNVFKSHILVLCLIKEGQWFDEFWYKCEFGLGSYVDVLADVYSLPNPIHLSKGGQNGISLTQELWDQIIDKNPGVLVKIQSWMILYKQHLGYFTNYSNLKIRTLHMPWAYLLYIHIKTIENRPTNKYWKIGENDDTNYNNVRCKTCFTKTNRCDSCEHIQTGSKAKSSTKKTNKK